MAKQPTKNAKKTADKSSARKLTPKQEMFVKEYLIDFNATRAATKAGYAPKTAYAMGSQLLKNIHIAAAIAEAKNKRLNKLEITADRIRAEMARIAFLDIGDIFNNDGSMKPLSEIDEDARRAIVGIEVAALRDEDGDYNGTIKKIKLADKRAALVDLGKHIGMFDQKVSVDAEGDGLALLIQAVQGSSFKPIAATPTDKDDD